MIYSIGRCFAIKGLNPEELEDLHKREVKRGFTLPFFNIKSLYWNSLKNVTLPTEGFTDQELNDFNQRISECRPKPELFDLESPTMSALPFVHEWDNNIYHNMQTIEIISKDKKKKSLME